MSGKCVHKALPPRGGHGLQFVHGEGSREGYLEFIDRDRDSRESWKVSTVGWRLLPLPACGAGVPSSTSHNPWHFGNSEGFELLSQPQGSVVISVLSDISTFGVGMISPGKGGGRCVCISILPAGNESRFWSSCDSHRPGEGSHLLQPLLCNPEGWIRALAAWLGGWFQSKAPGSPFLLTKIPFVPTSSRAGNLALTPSRPSKNPWLILAIQG